MMPRGVVRRLTAAPKVEERITDSGAAVVIMFTATIPFHRMDAVNIMA